jgi:hypothetical protein
MRTETAARKPLGRYDLTGSHDPANGRAELPRSLNARTVVGAVVDPWGNGRDRHLVTVNRRVDILEDEHAHGRISQAAYLVGREIQREFERYRGPTGGGQWCMGDRIDAARRAHEAVLSTIDVARRVLRLMHKLRRILGVVDAPIVQKILGEGKTYTEIAFMRIPAVSRAMPCDVGRYEVAYIAQRFRDALETLANEFAAKGRTSP